MLTVMSNSLAKHDGALQLAKDDSAASRLYHLTNDDVHN